MRNAALLLLAGAILSGCPKSEEAQTKRGTEHSSVSTPPEKASEAPKRAPDRYTVELDTTKGAIVIDVHRDWAPHGADRFYELVKDGYYTDVAFFRVIGGFMAQVGISGDPAINAQWRQKTIPDDPVKASNTRGTVTFATSGPNSRTTQFFINFADNSRLDSLGFAPFGKVQDMAPVDALYDGYGEGAPRGRGPSQGLIQSQGNAYLRESFPKLDYIKSAKILE
jgi:peptidyl-prolyl cis-trans isomerase A (cyclophilin A)